jgi:MFS family permease
MFGPIYAVFVEEIGGDLLTAGSSYALFSIAAGILIFFISRWEDHVKHQEKLIVIGYAIKAVAFMGYLFVGNPLDLFIVQAILGIGEAIGVPAYDGLYSKLLDNGKFISEWGLWESMFYIVTAVAALFGGFLANIYGFRFIFVIMFGFSILAVFSSAMLLSRKVKGEISVA